LARQRLQTLAQPQPENLPLVLAQDQDVQRTTKRVASTIGEGVMSVHLVHRRLATT
jgi:hypothetical protein